MHIRPRWPRAMDDDGAPVDYSYVASVGEGEKKRAEEMAALRTRQAAGAVLRRQPAPVVPPVDEYGTRARRALPQEEQAAPRGRDATWRPAVRARVSGGDAPQEAAQRVTSLGDAVKRDPFQVKVRRLSDDGEVEPAYSGYERVDEPAPQVAPAPEAPIEPEAPQRALEDMPEWYRVAQQNNLPGMEQYHEETHRTGYRDRDGRIKAQEDAQRHNPYQHLVGNRAPAPDAPRGFGGAQVVASGTRQSRAQQLAAGRRTAMPQGRQVRGAEENGAQQAWDAPRRRAEEGYPQQAGEAQRAQGYAQEGAYAPQGGEARRASYPPQARDALGVSEPSQVGESRRASYPPQARDALGVSEPSQVGESRRASYPPRRAVAYAQQAPAMEDDLAAWRQTDDADNVPQGKQAQSEQSYAQERAYAQEGADAQESDYAPRRRAEPQSAYAPRRETDARQAPAQGGYPPVGLPGQYAPPPRQGASPSQAGYPPAAYPPRQSASASRAGYPPAAYSSRQNTSPSQSAYPPRSGPAAPLAAYPPANEPPATEEEAPRRRSLPWAGIAASVMALLLVAVWILGMNYNTQTQQVIQQRLLDRDTLLNRYELSYQAAIEQECQRYNLHPAFVAAIVRTESHFDPSATSGKGARGLMQLMNDTYEWVHDKLDDPAEKSFDRMYDAETNLRYGCWYINFLSELFRGDPVCVAAAYHTGQNWMRNILNNSSYSSDGLTIAIDKIPDESTRDYARKVVDAYAVFKQKYYAATQW